MYAQWPNSNYKGFWTWSNFEVRSSIGRGHGLFTLNPVNMYTWIPHFGLQNKGRLYTVFCTSFNYYIDGDPEKCTFTYKNSKGEHVQVGSKGLAITMMINEPNPGQTANCILTSNGIIIAKALNSDTELLVSYGDSYTRNYKIGRKLPLRLLQITKKIRLPVQLIHEQRRIQQKLIQKPHR